KRGPPRGRVGRDHCRCHPEECAGMKAEHRKELQTNALADRMGRFVQRIKTRPKRGPVLWIAAGAIVLVLLGIVMWMRGQRQRENSVLWLLLDQGGFYEPDQQRKT